MHTASYELLMKPEESTGRPQTLSLRVGSGDETSVKWTPLGPSLGPPLYSVGVVMCTQANEQDIFEPLCCRMIFRKANMMRGSATW